MNIVTVVFYLCLICCSSIFHAGYGPELMFYKPCFADHEAGYLGAKLAGGKTSKGYNRDGTVVPFLQEFGSEDLLLRFLDPSIPNTDTTKLGDILFSGSLSLTRLLLCYYKNICRHMFLGIGTIAQNLTAGSITMDIDLKQPLTEKQEHLLEIFKTTMPDEVNISGLVTTFIDLGYNRKWEDFQTVDSVQFYLSGSIGTPQWVDGSHAGILQYPLAGNIAFNYVLTSIVEIAVHQHLTMGAFGTMISFQPAQGTFAVQETQSSNHILLDHSARGTLHIGRIFAADFYLECPDIGNNISATIGYGAIIGSKTKIVPLSSAQKDDPFVNLNPVFSSWYTSSMFIELGCPFMKHDKEEAFGVSLYFVAPIAGKYYPKINIIGGSLGLLFNYRF
jgi:hypothetical protein